MDDNKILFFDVETFQHNALVVFMDIEKNVKGIFHNDFVRVNDLVRDYTLCGYNNHFYDNYILTAMLNGWSNHQLKKLNDDIISGRRNVISVSSDIESIDCFQQISVSYPGLKKIEANMGKSIIESVVPFDLDRPLTGEELAEVIDYCKYDVETTIDIYKERKKSYFLPKEMLLDMLGNPNARKWNTTTISANILMPKPSEKWSSLRVPQEMMETVPEEVKELWEQVNEIGGEIKKKKVTIKDFDCKIEFGFGGLHGVHRCLKNVDGFIIADVQSFYPAIIENIQALGPRATGIYSDIKKQRVEAKANGEKERSDALKLVLNSTYGLLKNKYSTLNNPRASATVCVYGQIALYDLSKRLSAYGDIININTDGVGFVPRREGYQEAMEEWENDYDFVLEEEKFDKWIQRDVNNYIGVQGDYLKVKGGDVGRYNGDNLFNNNQLRIIDLCIVDKLVYGIDVIDTIRKNLDNPKLFQYVLQAGPTYEGTFDEDGNKYQKVNRVFAVKKDASPTLYKRRPDGGLVRYPDAPQTMKIWNGECDEFTDFKRIVDLDWYYKLVKKKLEGWE